jgi:putative ABC transport system permease protein
VQTREIGIRMALGAQKTRVLGSLLLDSLKWISVGLVAGGGTGVVLSRVLSSQLLIPGPKFLDPGVIVAVSPVTGALALGAAWFPARRAKRLDPAVTWAE